MNNLSQKDLIADMAVKNGYKLTLGQLLTPPLAAEYRRAHDELRKEGWIIMVKQNYKERRKNVYIYIPPDNKESKTEQYRKIQSTYPLEHREYREIERQIASIEKRERK